MSDKRKQIYEELLNRQRDRLMVSLIEGAVIERTIIGLMWICAGFAAISIGFIAYLIYLTFVELMP
jgi:hypothetical protein